MNGLAAGRKVADAVLYEGYLLFPYTAEARKNQLRWQFGVVVPRAYGESGNGEPWRMQTEALFEHNGAAECEVLVRFLHVESRTIEKCDRQSFVPVESLNVDGKEYISWDEALEREIRCVARCDDALTRTQIDIAPTTTTETLRGSDGSVEGRIMRRSCALRGTLTVSVEVAAAMRKIRIEIENHSQVGADGTDPASVERSVALRTSFISAHTLMALQSGMFLSLLDPPDYAAELAKGCRNQHTWPVLIADDDGGERSPHKAAAMLSSPIILYDYPAIAPQSEGDKFDGTEVDELLNLSVLSLSDEEKQKARATDERARGIIDRADQMAPEHFAKLHGALRYLESVGQRTENGNGAGTAEFGAFEEEAPGAGHIYVNGMKIAKGSSVRLRPVRRADVWDSFLDGKTAKVAGVYADFENQQYVAVTVDDDPANDLHDWYGRYLYFYPNEIETVETTS